MFVRKKGQRLAVLRPMTSEEAQRSIDEGRRIVEEERAGTLSLGEGEKQFNEIIADRKFTFVGFLGKRNAQVLDTDGKVIDKAQPGDSFIPEGDLAKLMKVGLA